MIDDLRKVLPSFSWRSSHTRCVGEYNRRTFIFATNEGDGVIKLAVVEKKDGMRFPEVRVVFKHRKLKVLAAKVSIAAVALGLKWPDAKMTKRGKTKRGTLAVSIDSGIHV